MPRPRHNRKIAWMPNCRSFKPAGIPLSTLEEIVITVVEAEALRLADYEGLYQTQAAEKMQVSRQTFGRILEAARRKITKAIVEGKAITIEGGEFTMDSNTGDYCSKCNYPLSQESRNAHENCPSCGNESSSEDTISQANKSARPAPTAEKSETPQTPHRGSCRGQGRGRRRGNGKGRF